MEGTASVGTLQLGRFSGYASVEAVHVDPIASASAAIKFVHFFRHAEAESNAAAHRYPRGSAEYSAAYEDPRYFDSILSAKGERQCETAKKTYASPTSMSYDLVICSPLRRTLETGARILENRDVPWVAHELAREHSHGFARPCDSRYERQEQAAKYSFVNFDNVPDGEDTFVKMCETDDDLDRRCVAFLDYITRGRPEKRIAVVSHTGFLTRIFSHHLPWSSGRAAFNNAELRSVVVRERPLEATLCDWKVPLSHWKQPLLARKLCSVFDSDGKETLLAEEDLKVLSFNLLADGKQKEEDWYSTPSHALAWECRRWRLLEELVVYRPDVLLLQEIDAIHFDSFWSEELAKVGFLGHFQQKTNGKVDGVAVFWKCQRLQLMSCKKSTLSQGSESLVAAKFEMREMVSKTVGKRVFVAASTHLRSGKDAAAESIREAQIKEVLTVLQDFAEGPEGGSRVPIILGADLNAEPSATEKVGEPLCLQAAQHHALKMRSAYPDPKYTTWKRRPKGEICRVIDYILSSEAPELRVSALLDLPDDFIMPEERLPTYSYPSDHLSLMAAFKFGVP